MEKETKKKKKKRFFFGLLFLGLLFVFMLVALNTLTAPPPAPLSAVGGGQQELPACKTLSPCIPEPATWRLMTFLFPSPDTGLTSTAPSSLLEPVQPPSPLLSPCTGHQGASHILPRYLRGHKGPGRHCQAGHKGHGGHREGGWWMLVARCEQGDEDVHRAASPGAPSGALCYLVMGGLRDLFLIFVGSELAVGAPCCLGDVEAIFCKEKGLGKGGQGKG